jgi:hypothetical protein
MDDAGKRRRDRQRIVNARDFWLHGREIAPVNR